MHDAMYRVKQKTVGQKVKDLVNSSEYVWVNTGGKMTQGNCFENGNHHHYTDSTSQACYSKP